MFPSSRPFGLLPTDALLWQQFIFPRMMGMMQPSPPVSAPAPSAQLTVAGGASIEMRQSPPIPLPSSPHPTLLLLEVVIGGSRHCAVIAKRDILQGESVQIPSSYLPFVRRCGTGVAKVEVDTALVAIAAGEEMTLLEERAVKKQSPLTDNEEAAAEEEERKHTSADSGFSCDRCGKVFSYAYYRDKHLKYTRCVDQGDRKFPCASCPRSFEKRDRLRIHVLHVHENHRPHQCSLCGKAFSQSSSLNKHLRVHSGERPYQCPFCTKAFTASSILRTHVRQHSGERPFKCCHCGKAFASHAAHDSHVRRTHTAGEKREEEEGEY